MALVHQALPLRGADQLRGAPYVAQLAIVTDCHAESRTVRSSHASEADRLLGAELTYRRLAARLARALAVAEDTIDSLGPLKGRLPEWGEDL